MKFLTLISNVDLAKIMICTYTDYFPCQHKFCKNRICRLYTFYFLTAERHSFISQRFTNIFFYLLLLVAHLDLVWFN